MVAQTQGTDKRRIVVAWVCVAVGGASFTQPVIHTLSGHQRFGKMKNKCISRIVALWTHQLPPLRIRISPRKQRPYPLLSLAAAACLDATYLPSSMTLLKSLMAGGARGEGSPSTSSDPGNSEAALAAGSPDRWEKVRPSSLGMASIKACPTSLKPAPLLRRLRPPGRRPSSTPSVSCF